MVMNFTIIAVALAIAALATVMLEAIPAELRILALDPRVRTRR